ncbi:TIMELESS-interacting protein [Dermacentor andersoni]|uniref:TIMELESS-interacting protein n=1 Tax=Dermacentor andersoni TaxID=34620 RepID=UPI003B3B0F72
MDDLMEDYPLDGLENGDGAPEESAGAADNGSEQEETGENVKPPVKKRVVTNPRPKLNKDRLAGAKGIPELLRMSKNVHWRGKGHELHDLDTALSLLEHWGHRLFPQMDSDNLFSNLERLGMKREVQTYMRKLRMGLEGDVGEQLQFGENLDDGIVEEKDEEQPPFEDPFSSLLAEGPQSTSQQVLPAAPPLFQQPKDITEELRERMERSRQQALERRRLRLAQQELLSRDMDTEETDFVSALNSFAKGEQGTDMQEDTIQHQPEEREDHGISEAAITLGSDSVSSRGEQANTQEIIERHPEDCEGHSAATTVLEVVPVVSDNSE